MLNNNNESVHNSDVSFHISTLDKKNRLKINAITAKKVVGDMTATKRNTETQNFSHLKGVSFPEPAAKDKVDILIGIDNIHLHSSIKELTGNVDEPIARLTPLGWTCIGKIKEREKLG